MQSRQSVTNIVLLHQGLRCNAGWLHQSIAGGKLFQDDYTKDFCEDGVDTLIPVSFRFPSSSAEVFHCYSLKTMFIKPIHDYSFELWKWLVHSREHFKFDLLLTSPVQKAV